MLASNMAKGVLKLLEWKPPPLELHDFFQNNDKVVVLFSHTANADMGIFALYLLAYPELFFNLFMVVADTVKVYGKFFPNATMIGRKKREGNGILTKIVNTLKEEEKFQYMLSPRGDLNMSSWRSGYHTVATQLDAKIIVVSLDFVKRSVIFNGKHIQPSTREQDEPTLKLWMSEVVPMYPELETIPVACTDYAGIGTCGNLVYVILFAIILLIVAIICKNEITK